MNRRRVSRWAPIAVCWLAAVSVCALATIWNGDLVAGAAMGSGEITASQSSNPAQPTDPPANPALAYTFVTSWRVQDGGQVSGRGWCGASGGLLRRAGDMVYDASGQLFMLVECCRGERGPCQLELTSLNPGDGSVESALFSVPMADVHWPLAYDPTSHTLVSASSSHLYSLRLPAATEVVRRWELLRVPGGTSNVPEDIAVGPDGVVFTFSRAGVGRYGPGDQRYSPWRPMAAPQPGTLFVAGDGYVYVQDANLSDTIARFSSGGRLDLVWRLQEGPSPARAVAGYPGSRQAYLLQGGAGGLPLEVWRIAPDGAVTARLPVNGRLIAQPTPLLAVGPGGVYALQGQDASGATWLFLHTADGTEQVALKLIDPSARVVPMMDIGHVSTASDDRILVTTRTSTAIYAADGNQLSQWQSPFQTLAATMGPDGAVYLWRRLGADASLLERYDQAGTVDWSRDFPVEAGSGLAVSAKWLFACVRLSGMVAIHDPADGRRIGSLPVSTPNDLFLPSDVAVDRTGRVYVLDNRREEVQLWDLDASLLRPVGRVVVGSTDDTFRPQAIAAASDGLVAIIEAGQPESAPGSFTRLRIVDGLGATLWTLEAPTGPVPGAWFEDVAFDGRGRLVVLGNTNRPLAGGSYVVLVFAPDSPAVPPPARPTATLAPTPLPANEGACRVTGDKWAEPGEVWLGESVTVTLTLGQTCPPPAGLADIVLVVDTSGSMAGDKAQAVGQAVKAFVAELDLLRHRLGVVTFATKARLRLSLTGDLAELARLPPNFGADGNTNMHDGLRLATNHLLQQGRPEAKWVIILFTDGEPNEGGDPEPAAFAARRAGIRVFAVGTADANLETLLRITAAPDRVYWVSSERGLPELYRKIAELIGQDAGRLALDDLLGADVAYVSGSVSEPPLGMSPNLLRWAWPGMAVAPMTITYQVRPLRPGWVPTNQEAWLDYEDADGAVRRYVYPVPRVLVKVRWTVTPTPTATPVPSWTATPTATPTRTPRPGRIYLPIALREPPCQPEKQRIDAVLVIDTSTSMLESTRAGRQKLEAARQAAGAFLDRLRLGVGDQAALVYFNREAWLAQGLTSDRSALDRALSRAATAMQTCLVCGVEAAHEELRGPRHRDAAKPVMILLTDGLSNPRPASEAVAAARRAKSAGVVIFTIGLGRELDFDALRAMASEPGYFYQTSDAEALDGIYAAIAIEIPCPANAYWGGRP